MICPPCKQAGQELPNLTLIGQAKRGNYPGILKLIKALHARCQAPSTCPCHHEVTTEAIRSA